jgi:ABC-type branched-subunit amino acid transport system ATPase component
MLTLENVSVNYGAIEALTGVSMHVEQGAVVTLIGANGAGKTTTLRTITGLLQPRQGRVVFEGEDISAKPTHKLVARGMSRRTAVLTLYLLTAATSVAAILLPYVTSTFAAMLIFAQTLLVLGVVALLEQHPLPSAHLEDGK